MHNRFTFELSLHPWTRLQKYMSAFSASKYALYGLTEALRAEVAQDNIHVGQASVVSGSVLCVIGVCIKSSNS